MKYLDIGVDNLELDCDNPRHRHVESQRAALDALIAGQRHKLAELALDIASNGLSPGHRMLVVETGDGHYTVLDGNRRLAALRLLEDPSVLPAGVGPADFAQRVSSAQAPQEVACCVMPDRDSARAWLERTHAGELGGKGLVAWSAAAKQRFAPPGRPDQASRAVTVLDWLRPLCAEDADTQVNIEKVEEDALTNLGRLMSDPYVRDIIGLRFDGDEVSVRAGSGGVVPRVKAVVADLAGGTRVASLMSKSSTRSTIRSPACPSAKAASSSSSIASA